MHSTLLLQLPTPSFCSRLFRSGNRAFLVFLYLLSLCPSCACAHLLLVPYGFFVFHSSRRGMSKWKPCSKWPQKPVYLRQTLHLGGRELVMQAGKEESSLPLLLSWANLEKLRLVCGILPKLFPRSTLLSH